MKVLTYRFFKCDLEEASIEYFVDIAEKFGLDTIDFIFAKDYEKEVPVYCQDNIFRRNVFNHKETGESFDRVHILVVCDVGKNNIIPVAMGDFDMEDIKAQFEYRKKLFKASGFVTTDPDDGNSSFSASDIQFNPISL